MYVKHIFPLEKCRTHTCHSCPEDRSDGTTYIVSEILAGKPPIDPIGLYVLSSNSEFPNDQLSTNISSNIIFQNRHFVEKNRYFFEQISFRWDVLSNWCIHFLPVELSNIQQNLEATIFLTFNKISNTLGFRTNWAYLACSLTPLNWAVLF
jgi:hypothetical protein